MHVHLCLLINILVSLVPNKANLAGEYINNMVTVRICTKKYYCSQDLPQICLLHMYLSEHTMTTMINSYIDGGTIGKFQGTLEV